MRKKRRLQKKQKQNKNIIFLLGLIGLVIIASLFTRIYFKNQSFSKIASQDAKNTLQIDIFYPSATPTNPPTPTSVPNPILTATPTSAPTRAIAPTATPTTPPSTTNTCGIASAILITNSDSSGCCIEDGGGGSGEHCCNGVPSYTYTQAERDQYHQTGPFPPDNMIFWCDAKPVIYLYPQQDTLVNVNITVPGEITKSIPQYPAGGWKNVLAKPSGKLSYYGKTYSELFYESQISPTTPPRTGFIVSSSTIQGFLKDFAINMGLKENEAQELASYWTPKLQTLNSPYIFVSVFDPITKDKIDHVEISPKPDTFIQMILYFKPLSKFESIAPLEITPAPTREGFAAVEWGGIIDRN